MAASLLDDAFAHHVWATERVIDACVDLTPDQLSTSVPGTYGSIIATLRHLVSSDRWYLSFLPAGEGLEAIDEQAEIGLGELRTAIGRNGAAWTEVLAGDLDPDRDIVEIDDVWEVHSPLGLRLAQVVHHGTDHRSQVCTILGNLGIEAPEIDLWGWARETGRERAVRLDAG
jgi:uncharacterized damage-inducible protein DinB